MRFPPEWLLDAPYPRASAGARASWKLAVAEIARREGLGGASRQNQRNADSRRQIAHHKDQAIGERVVGGKTVPVPIRYVGGDRRAQPKQRDERHTRTKSLHGRPAEQHGRNDGLGKLAHEL